MILEKSLETKEAFFVQIPSFEYPLQKFMFKETAGNAHAILRVNFPGYVESHQTMEGTF